MGRTVKILKKTSIPASLCNTRFTVELCENVHLHYRNIRLEFKKDEFLHILNLLQKIDKNEIKNFSYNNYNFKLLIEDFNLPSKCEYDKRLQIEWQKEGHYHIHYRNCRLEFKKLREIGFHNIQFLIPMLRYKFSCIFLNLQKKIFLTIYRKKSTMNLLQKKFNNQIDQVWAKDFTSKNPFYHHYRLSYLPLKKLKAVLFVKEGLWTYPLNLTPQFLYLNGDKEAYRSYCEFKDIREGKDKHNIARFEKLLNSIKTSEKLHCLIVINQRNEILDGLHRASFLMYKYGPEHKILVLKLY